MTLIIGGAFQGKHAYVKEAFSLSEGEIFDCRDMEIDAASPAVAGLEKFSLACVRAGKEPIEELRARLPGRGDKILISDDVSCGVVPTDPVLRAWREAHGRMVNALAGEAERVVRLFCGLPQVLK